MSKPTDTPALPATMDPARYWHVTALQATAAKLKAEERILLLSLETMQQAYSNAATVANEALVALRTDYQLNPTDKVEVIDGRVVITRVPV